MISFNFGCESFSFSFHSNLLEQFKRKIKESNNKLKHIINKSENGIVKKWEIVYHFGVPTSLKQDQNFGDQNSFVKQVLFNEQTQEIVSIEDFKSIRIWDAINGKEKQSITPTHFPRCIKFYSKKQSNKKYLIVGYEDEFIEIWDWETKRSVKIIPSRNYIWHLELNEENGELLTCGGSDVIELWCLETFALKKRYFVYELLTAAKVRFIGTHKMQIAASGYKDICVYDKISQQCLCLLKNVHDGYIGNLLYSTDLNLLISTCNKNIKMWEIVVDDKSIKLKLDFEILQVHSCIKTLEFSNLNKQTQIVACCEDGLVFVDLILKKMTRELYF